MEPLDTTCLLMDDDDLLNFSLEDEDYVDEKTKNPLSSSSNPHTQDPDDPSRSFPGFVEEELEWILNKDAFPAVETCLGISSSFSAHQNDQSPVSVLENSNGSTIMRNCGTLLVPVSFPVRARSKRIIKRRRVFPELPTEYPKPSPTVTTGAAIGRRCQHCQAEKTPQWRAGPMGPKTLCNACGVRYKSGRLVPEYRPASSPTFSSDLHSNSHRKIMEMRRQNQVGEIPVEEASNSRTLGLSSFILDSIL